MKRTIQYFLLVALLALTGCTTVKIQATDGSHITIGGNVANEAHKAHTITPETSIPVSVVP